jgi:transcriptional regulator with XRE-family HTH domain
MTTKQLAEALGYSERTGQRWFASESSPSAMTMIDLARLVYPVNEPLAAEIAASAGKTLESLGLVRPAPPAEPAAPGPPHPAAPLPADALVDSVVCAAARAANVPPDAQLGAVLAAFQRARALRMSVEDVVDALAPKPPAGGRKSR